MVAMSELLPPLTSRISLDSGCPSLFIETVSRHGYGIYISVDAGRDGFGRYLISLVGGFAGAFDRLCSAILAQEDRRVRDCWRPVDTAAQSMHGEDGEYV